MGDRAAGRRPDTFVVGAAKAGTTSLCSYLAAHPHAFVPTVKEPHHFAADLGLADTKGCGDLASYLALYAGADQHHLAVVDGSPSSLLSSEAASRIAGFAPDARIVVILRDPVEVVASLHDQLALGGLQPDPDLGRAVAVAAEHAGEPLDGLGWRAWTRYLDVVDYVPQLRRYLAVFPPEQVTVLLFDDLRDDPAGTWRSLQDRLGLPPAEVDLTPANTRKQVARPGLQRAVFNPPPVLERAARAVVPRALGRRVREAVWRRNVRASPATAPAPATVAWLRERLRPGVEQLEELLRRDLAAWRSPPP